MKKITLLVSLIISLSAFTQTSVSGNQSGTWTITGSPYEVNGYINVPFGETLTIQAGVEINFQGHYKFNVNGKLLVNGTEENMVLFTTDNTSTGWGGIRFDTVSEISIFNYCKIEFGKATGDYPDMHGGAILLKESNAEFYNCIFENNEAYGSSDDGMGGAVYGINTGSETQTYTKFIDCTFKDNHAVTEGGAVKLTNDGHTEFTRCKFINNNANYGGGAIMFYSALDVNLTNCLFYLNSTNNSGGGAIKAMNPTVSLFFTNCTFAYNSAFGGSEGGAIALDYADATFVNSIIYGNSQTYGDEINIGMNASASINYCNVDMPNDATGNNNLDNVNPLFVNIGLADFHLQETSPCINVGTDVGLPFSGTSPDIGCYEFEEDINTVQEFNTNSITVYPNPANNIININGITNSKEITIYSVLGKKVYVKNQNLDNLDISNLKEGTYFVKIKNNNQKLNIIKLIIKR